MLNLIDGCLTEIMLAWEKFCAKKSWNQQPCSPKQQEVARISSYWKQKHLMAQRKLFHQCHLDQLQKDTSILDCEHDNYDSCFIYDQTRLRRNKWRSAKNHSHTLCKTFLQERANYMASKMNTTGEKALQAIMRTEESWGIYKTLKELMGKQNSPLTQIDTMELNLTRLILWN
jgi:hypothetical protein